MRAAILKFVLAALVLFALAWSALVVAGATGPAGFAPLGWLLGAFAAIGAMASWRAVGRRRERQRLESMRDSALW